jgi:hypothetical protein
VPGGREQDLGGRGFVQGRGLEHVGGGSVVPRWAGTGRPLAGSDHTTTSRTTWKPSFS